MYFYNNKFIFPEINRILKIRQVKIADLQYKEIKLLNIYSLYEKINLLTYGMNKNSEIFFIDYLLKISTEKIIILSLLFQFKLNLNKTKNSYSTLLKQIKFYL